MDYGTLTVSELLAEKRSLEARYEQKNRDRESLTRQIISNFDARDSRAIGGRRFDLEGRRGQERRDKVDDEMIEISRAIEAIEQELRRR